MESKRTRVVGPKPEFQGLTALDNDRITAHWDSRVGFIGPLDNLEIVAVQVNGVVHHMAIPHRYFNDLVVLQDQRHCPAAVNLGLSGAVARG